MYPGESLKIEFEYILCKPLTAMGFTLGIYNELNIKCFETKIVSLSNAFDPLTPRCKFTCQLPELPLLPDLYYINIGLYPPKCDYTYDYHRRMHTIFIMSKNGSEPGDSGIVSLRPVWTVKEKD